MKMMNRVAGWISGDRIVLLNGPYIPLFVSSQPINQVHVDWAGWKKDIEEAIDEHERLTGVRLHA